jgi:hypothetical protein
VKVEYLENGSPDCPLIRIYGTDKAEFSALRDVSRQLAGGKGTALSVNDTPGFYSVGGCELEMVSSSRDAGVKQVGKARFIWELTPSSWSVVAGLIEPFTRDLTGEGHQWLSGKEARYGLAIGVIAVLISNSPQGRW